MTPRQKVFVQEYLIDLNGSAAARRAGYSANNAEEHSCEMLKMPDIKAAVESGIAQRLARVNMKQDTALVETSLLAFSCITHYVINSDDGTVTPAEGAPEGCMRAVQSVKRRKHVRFDKDGSVHVTFDVEVKLWDKTGPLKLMGRHVGLFPDRVEHTGPNGAPIELVTRIERVIVDPKQLGE